MLLIEGHADALRFMADLLYAVADEEANDGFSLSLFGAGSAHFSEDSEVGFYMYRTGSHVPQKK